jgi:predicted Zn-ribbon and HTH transcriptional regulator
MNDDPQQSKNERASQLEFIRQMAVLLTNLKAPVYIQSVLHSIDSTSAVKDILPELKYINQLLYHQDIILEAYGATERIIGYTITDEQFYQTAIAKALELEDYENAAVLKKAREYYLHCIQEIESVKN